MAQKPTGLHIDRFIKGLVTNRAAISVPQRVGGLGGVTKYFDALIDGSNVEISPSNTLARRPGFPKYSTATFSAETPKGFTSGIFNGTLYKLFDTDSKVYLFDTTSLTSIYTKGTTAQTHYQQVGNILYFSDGTNNKKFSIGTSSDVSVTNAGITPPANAPTVPNLNFYDSGGGTQTVHSWVPGATYTNATASAIQFYLMAPTGEIQWAVVPAGSTLQSQNSAPDWASEYGTFGGVVKDGTMTWTNCGPVLAWAANTVFSNSTYVTNNNFSSVSSTGTSGTTGSATNNWTVGTSVGIGPTTSSGNTNTYTFTNLGLSLPAGATVQGIQVSVNRAANRANAISDVTVKLLKASVATGNNKAAAGFWPFTTGSNFYTVPTSGGVRQDYGSNTDLWGTTWSVSDVTNSGFGVEFVANNASTRTTTGALVFPITITVYYKIATTDITGTVYAQVVQDTNGNLQRAKVGGTSGGSAPSWSTTIGGTTTDNGITWENIGTGHKLAALTYWSYAYGFHTGSPHLSTMSPELKLFAPILGNNVNIQGFGSDDTQCDRNDLYRTADGGSTFLYCNTAPNVNSSTSWTIIDTDLDGDLNEELQGPVDFANNPPPAGATLLAYHTGRMWAAVGNLLYFSAGPDCINGDGNQAWPPANVFTFPAPVNGLAPTSQGLVVFTATDVEVVLGGPQLETYWVQPLRKNFGVLSSNCVAQDGDDIAVYTASRQLFSFSAQGQNELGFDVAGTLASNFDPSSSYLAIHRQGQDQGVFLSNGSTKVIRYNLNAESWDPLATPSAGIGPMASIDTALGTRTLVSTANGFIVGRDTATFSDSGSAYSAYATIGSILLSDLGDQPASIQSVLLAYAAVGTDLTVSVLPNEVSGSFTSIPLSNSDPPQLSGTAYESSTLKMKEYQWLGVGSPLPNFLKHVQIKITMSASDTVKNEVYSASLSPVLMQ